MSPFLTFGIWFSKTQNFQICLQQYVTRQETERPLYNTTKYIRTQQNTAQHLTRIDWDRGKQYVLWSLDQWCFPGWSRGKHWVRATTKHTASVAEVTVNECFVIYQLSKGPKNQKQNIATMNISIQKSLKTFQKPTFFSELKQKCYLPGWVAGFKAAPKWGAREKRISFSCDISFPFFVLILYAKQ